MVRIVDDMLIETGQVRIGAVRFSSDADIVFHLNRYSDKNSLKNAILQMAYLGGGTNTAAGITITHKIEFMPENGDRPDIQNIAIIVTDGRSNNYNYTISSAEAARNDGIHIYTVGVTSNINEEEMRKMASHPQLINENYFLATNFNSLTIVADALASTACKISGKIMKKVFGSSRI